MDNQIRLNKQADQTKLTASAIFGEDVKISVILDCNSGGDRASSSVDWIRETLKTHDTRVFIYSLH